MARKKTPPEYGESDYSNVSMMIHGIPKVKPQSCRLLVSRQREAQNAQRDLGRLTGPMMVACQWNYIAHRVSPRIYTSVNLCNEGLVLRRD